MSHRSLAGFTFLAAAAAWPAAVNAIEFALMSPLQRALRESFCGSPLHGSLELLGHCSVCWTGSALLLAAGSLLLSRRELTLSAARQH